MKTITQYFREYETFHTRRGNEVCHYVGIPTLMVATLGLLAQITFTSGEFRLDAGVFLWLIASVWFVLLDWRLGAPFSLVILGTYFLGRALPMSANWVLFIAGWILQGVGHAVSEKRSPAFFKNLEHLLIGPLWVFARLVRY